MSATALKGLERLLGADAVEPAQARWLVDATEAAA
jgi:hypothetical protein